VKTAISVPDSTYERVTRRAAELGMSRSELFARAADEYLDRLDDAVLVEEINHVVATVDVDEPTWVVDHAHRRLTAEDEEW
jgi:metal-responsive CopG/Arc/MetJ family transcriptional regulator